MAGNPRTAIDTFNTMYLWHSTQELMRAGLSLLNPCKLMKELGVKDATTDRLR